MARTADFEWFVCVYGADSHLACNNAMCRCFIGSLLRRVALLESNFSTVGELVTWLSAVVDELAVQIEMRFSLSRVEMIEGSKVVNIWIALQEDRVPGHLGV